MAFIVAVAGSWGVRDRKASFRGLREAIGFNRSSRTVFLSVFCFSPCSRLTTLVLCGVNYACKKSGKMCVIFCVSVYACVTNTCCVCLHQRCILRPFLLVVRNTPLFRTAGEERRHWPKNKLRTVEKENCFPFLPWERSWWSLLVIESFLVILIL